MLHTNLRNKEEAMSFGWAGQILRADLSDGRISKEPVEPYTRHFIGGRGVSAKMLFDEVAPKLSLYDPANRIFFGPGVLTGTPAAGSSRLKVTGVGAGGWVRAAGLGGNIPQAMKWAGYDLIVVQGKSDTPVYLYIHDDSVEIRDASHIWGKDTYETQLILKDELGKPFEVMCIGPGGENEVAFGSIHTDWGSAAGRCGFGGVMGSKKLKAIAVKGTRGVRIAKLEEFLKLAEEQREAYAANKEGIETMQTVGTKCLAWAWQRAGVSPRGNFEECDWDLMQFTKMDDFYNKYGVCPHVCGSCPIEHFTTFEMRGVGKGAAKCTGTHSVTVTIWNNDWELAFRAYNLINRYGLDIISTCNIIAFLMELYDRGIITAEDTDGVPMKKGNEDAIITAIRKIGEQEGFGRLFKEGVVQGAKQIGSGAEKYAMAVKGMELEPYEYRVIKQMALATATNTKDLIDSINIFAFDWAETLHDEIRENDEKMAEEMYGTREAAYPHSYEAAAAPTVDMENRTLAADMVGVCKWLIPWYMTPYLDVPAKMFSLATGVEMSEADLLSAAARVVTLERAVNVMKGMRRKDDTLPKRLFQEPVPGGRYKGERLIKAKFDKMLDSYYALRGYDRDGIPKEETFKKYGLLPEWQVFKKKALVVAKESSKAGEE
jgi:aldehyde:ferredoxin oxidoreductase